MHISFAHLILSFRLKSSKEALAPLTTIGQTRRTRSVKRTNTTCPIPCLPCAGVSPDVLFAVAAIAFMTDESDELERQVREAQETVKQLRRMAPPSIHDTTAKQLALQSKDLEDVLATGVVDKSVPARVRVPSDLCASATIRFMCSPKRSHSCCSAICDIAKAAKRLDKKCVMLKVPIRV